MRVLRARGGSRPTRRRGRSATTGRRWPRRSSAASRASSPRRGSAGRRRGRVASGRNTRHGTPAMSWSTPAGDTTSNAFIISRCARTRSSRSVDTTAGAPAPNISAIACAVARASSRSPSYSSGHSVMRATLSRSGVGSPATPQGPGPPALRARPTRSRSTRDVGEPGTRQRARARARPGGERARSPAHRPPGRATRARVGDQRLDAPRSRSGRSPARARGSHSATSLGRSATSCSAMYGGFDTITRSLPRSSGGNASVPGPRVQPHARRRRSRCRRRWHARRPTRRRSRRWPTPRRRAARVPAPSAIAPEPVPRSATAYDVSAASHASCFPRRAPRRTASSIAVCATTSVSGRGTSTRRSTSRSSPRKSHRPSTYCSGSPPARRSSMSSRCCAAGAVGQLLLVDDQLGAVVARDAFHHPAGLGVGPAAAFALAQARLGAHAEVGPGGHDRGLRASSPSWRCRSSAMSASVRSSS